jgi:ATP-binding cassette subfamily C (CFTR/MRP) protein 1
MAIGVLTRASLISAIYKRSLSMTVGARATHPNGRLTNYISSDVSWSEAVPVMKLNLV